MGGATTEVTAATTDILVESAHFDPITVARSSRRHKLVTEAVQALRARRRHRPRRGRRAAGRRPAAAARRGSARRGRHRRRPARAARAGPARRQPCRPGWSACPTPAQDVVDTLREIGCDGRRPRRRARTCWCCRPAGAPTCRTAPTSPRRSPACAATTRSRPCCPRRPAGRGLTHDQRVRRVVADTLAERRACSRCSPTPSSGRRCTTSSGWRPTTRDATRCGWPTRCREEAPLMRTSVLSTLLEALRRNVSRGQRDVALFELGLVTRPELPLRVAPVPGVQTRPDDETLQQMLDAVPHQPRRVALALAGDADRAGWWGPGRPADWSDAVTPRAPSRRRWPSTLVVSADEHAPWHPGRCARLTLPDGTLVGHAGELHPKALAALGLPERTCAAELDVDVLSAASDDGRARTASVHLPGRAQRRRARRRGGRPGRRRRGRPARGHRRAAGDPVALRRLHRRPGRATSTGPWPTGWSSAPRTAR